MACRLKNLFVSCFRCCGSEDVVGLGNTMSLVTDVCGLAGKSVFTGHVKSYTPSSKDMLDPVALNDSAVVWPHNGDYPLPSTNFGMVLVHGSCHAGSGSSGSTDLLVNKTNQGIHGNNQFCVGQVLC